MISAPSAEAAPHGSRSELVYRKLRDAIAHGALKPGQRVMENEVADWLKVSRTPVRDAIRRHVHAAQRERLKNLFPDTAG